MIVTPGANSVDDECANFLDAGKLAYRRTLYRTHGGKQIEQSSNEMGKLDNKCYLKSIKGRKFSQKQLVVKRTRQLLKEP